MNWDALGALGEIVGAAAVVISVVYLAVQIRRQTNQERLSASRELAEAWNQSMNQVSMDQEFADLYLKAVVSYDSLPNRERIRMSAFLFQMMRTLEQQYLHVIKGHLDPDFFQSAERSFVEFLVLPGVHEYWKSNNKYFSEAFCNYVEQQTAKAKEQEYSSTFKAERENPPNQRIESDT